MRSVTQGLRLMAMTATLGSPFVVSGQARGVAAPQVTTRSGVVRGLVLPSGVRAFRGLPFAVPPVRDRRWTPPVAPAAWPGVRAADRFAPMCMQPRIYSDMVFRSDGTSEDCLYLNVWAPAKATRGTLPVLV
jgi:para-nitrobenzyl esterase